MTGWCRTATQDPRSAGWLSRRYGGATATVLLVVGGAVLVGATPAAAAITGFPAAPYTSNTTIAIRASVSQSSTQSTLMLTDPAGLNKQVAATTTRDILGRYDATTLSYALVTTCEQAATNSCSGDHPALNGTWVVRTVGDSANTDTRQFRIDIAPRIPAEVAVTATGPSQITVTWQPNTEPDLQQYDILDGAGHALRPVPASSCGPAACSSVFDYPATASGARSFSVSATRAAPVEPTGSLSSPASSSRQAVLSGPAASPSAEPSSPPSSPPSSSPTAAPSDGGASGGGASGGSTGGPAQPGQGSAGGQPTVGPGGAKSPSSAAAPASGDGGQRAAAAALAARTAFAKSFSSFEPPIGLNKLPPLPANDGPILAAGEPGDGAYQPTLGYADKIAREPVPATRTAARMSSSFGQILDDRQLAKTLAITLLLVLGGLHLRRWSTTGFRT